MKLIENLSYKKIFGILVLARLALLLITPGSLLTDGYAIYAPSIDTLLKGSLDFWYPPLYIIFLAPFKAILSQDLFVLFAQLTSIAFSVFALCQIKCFLEKLKVRDSTIKLTILVSGLLTWSLLTSVAFHSDALFFAIFAYGLNVVWELANANQGLTEGSNGHWNLQAIIVILALLATKPLAWFAIASYGLLYLSLKVKKLNVKSLLQPTLEFGVLVVIGILLFSPWLIKNQNEYGTFYLSASDEEYAGALEFIDIDKVPTQVEKLSAYFWEYPDGARSGQLMQDVSSQSAKIAIASYYIGNVIIFGLLSILIIGSMIKTILEFKSNKVKTQKFLTKPATHNTESHPLNSERITRNVKLLLIALPIISFAVFYWPFFGKYNYWDAGRYSFIIMPLLIALIFQTNKSILKNKAIVFLLSFAVLLSIVNAVVVSGYILLNDSEANDAISHIELGKKIVTNDAFFKTIADFKLEKNLDLEEVDEGNSEVIYRNSRYIVFETEDSLYIRTFSPSRNF